MIKQAFFPCAGYFLTQKPESNNHESFCLYFFGRFLPFYPYKFFFCVYSRQFFHLYTSEKMQFTFMQFFKIFFYVIFVIKTPENLEPLRFVYCFYLHEFLQWKYKRNLVKCLMLVFFLKKLTLRVFLTSYFIKNSQSSILLRKISSPASF